jgi:methionyl-tRNA synthetase
VRQHGIYWPAFLMAADLPIPKKLVSHGWWMMEGAKMSKSLGNVVRPKDYVDRFGVDAFRYFVMREMVFGQDADFTDEMFLARYNADLANDLGNLVSRATTMIHRYCHGVVPKPGQAGEREIAIQKQLLALIPSVKAHVTKFELSFALKDIWEAIGAANRYIVANEPWKIAKDPAKREQLQTTLYLIADCLRVIGELLRPFIPASAERALGMIGASPTAQSWQDLTIDQLDPGPRLGETAPLFPRIEQTVEELRRMADEQPAAAPAAPAAPPEPARISIDDFMKIELRVAKVLAAERVPKSTKLIKLQVDVGSEQRQLVAGIAEAYEPEALVGRTVVIVFNLKPAKLMGVESNGMVLAASPEGGKPMLVGFETPPDPGTRVR